MTAFACASCRMKLSVKDELAGKKVKCPGCGAVTAVPDKAAVAPASGKLRPAAPPAPADPDQPTVPPSAVSDLPTAPPPSQSDGTESAGAGASDDVSSLTAFLAPPQAAGELGRLGGFRILKILGHGGMGVVFEGEDPRLGRRVAIKAMLPHLAGSKSSQERFVREAKAAAALEHDHVVPILQVGEDRGAPFIVMPFLKGEPLDARLKRDEKLPVTEVLRIGREIAEGLAAAHAKGLIHRDIKPANAWLEAPRQRVKILDFGLARAAAQESGLTQQGAIIGTPAYMAPEQAAGEQVGPRCDLFSLGVVLYRLCTGTQPFRGKDTISTLLAVATQDPQPPAAVRPEVPAALSELVMRLLAKKPEDRPASARAVADALQRLEKQPGTARATRPAPQAPRGQTGGTTQTDLGRARPRRAAGKRSRLPWLLGGGVLGLGVLGVVGFLLWPGHNAPSAGHTPPGPLPPTPTHRLPNGKEPTDKEPTPKEPAPRPAVTDPLPVGSVWVGTRTRPKGRTFACELRVRERDGKRFKGHISVGPNEAQVEGLLDGQTISWRQENANLVITCEGTLEGGRIHFTFNGTGGGRGHGALKRRDGS
jgi:hypothetical protein